MNRKKRVNMPLGMGVPMMLSIFVILLMCTLSLMTYLKAVNTRDTVEREIRYTSAYYKADLQAKQLLDENKDDLDLEIALGDGRILRVIRVNGKIEEYRVAEEGK